MVFKKKHLMSKLIAVILICNLNEKCIASSPGNNDVEDRVGPTRKTERGVTFNPKHLEERPAVSSSASALLKHKSTKKHRKRKDLGGSYSPTAAKARKNRSESASPAKQRMPERSHKKGRKEKGPQKKSGPSKILEDYARTNLSLQLSSTHFGS